MRIEVLGHWVGAPMGGGAASSYLVSGDGTNVLLDCGAGTLPMLHSRGLAQRLDAILISHMHRDHMLDLLALVDMAAICALYPGVAGWKKPRLLVPPGGIGMLVTLNDIWYGGREDPDDDNGPDAPGLSLKRLHGAFDVEEYRVEDRLELGDLTATFKRTYHNPGHCFSTRLTDGQATVVYSGDSGYTPELAAHAAGADLFLCEATFSESHPYWTETHGHLTGELAGRLAAEARVGRLVLTHLGPDAGVNAANLARARARFGGTVDLAHTASVYHV